MILTPGPVEVSSNVLLASQKHIPHRSGEFREIMSRSLQILRDTSKCHKVAITTGSGTTAVDMMVHSLLKTGEKVVCISYGEFGDRFAESIRRRGCDLHVLAYNENQAADPDMILREARKHGATSIALVHNETGNGTMLSNLREISTSSSQAGLNVIVDSVSGFAALPLEIKKWGISAVATCGHKGISSLTGVAINILSDETEKRLNTISPATQYLDLRNSLTFMEKMETPYTPAIGPFSALSAALGELSREGIEERNRRTKRYAKYVISALQENGYKVAGTDQTRSDCVLNIETKSNTSALISKLHESGFEVSGGMKNYRGKAVRIGLMGHIHFKDIVSFVETFLKLEREIG